jgi:hypothetical protein
MAGSMKHDTEFLVDRLRQRTLPHAPLAMPPQELERPVPFFAVLRLFFRNRFRRA